MADYKKRILVVNDNQTSRVMFRRALEGEDRRVEDVASGMLALEAVQQRHFDLVLLDVNMPGMDGFETAQRMSELLAEAAPPIIFITAVAKEDAFIKRGFELGAVDYLTVPTPIPLLRNKVTTLLKMFEQESQLAEWAHTLEARVVQRTKELEAAKIQAESGVRSKNEFLAIISHELFTPMNGILGMAQLLDETDLDEDSRDLVASLQTSSHELMGLLRDIIDYTKVADHHLTTPNAEFDLEDTLDAVTQRAYAACDKKGLDFRVDLSPNLPDGLLGNGPGLGLVLKHLLDNAVKFTEEGSVRVDVDWERLEANCGMLKVKVVDTGIGIPEELQELCFQHFTQADSSDRRKHGGLGLGLSIVNRLVKAQGGTVELQSEIDVGSTFSIALEFQVPEWE